MVAFEGLFDILHHDLKKKLWLEEYDFLWNLDKEELSLVLVD